MSEIADPQGILASFAEGEYQIEQAKRKEAEILEHNEHTPKKQRVMEGEEVIVMQGRMEQDDFKQIPEPIIYTGDNLELYRQEVYPGKVTGFTLIWLLSRYFLKFPLFTKVSKAELGNCIHSSLKHTKGNKLKINWLYQCVRYLAARSPDIRIGEEDKQPLLQFVVTEQEKNKWQFDEHGRIILSNSDVYSLPEYTHLTDRGWEICDQLWTKGFFKHFSNLQNVKIPPGPLHRKDHEIPDCIKRIYGIHLKPAKLTTRTTTKQAESNGISQGMGYPDLQLDTIIDELRKWKDIVNRQQQDQEVISQLQQENQLLKMQLEDTNRMIVALEKQLADSLASSMPDEHHHHDAAKQL